jgi:hypothetical protein
MALEDEHGGPRASAEQAGLTAYYRGEHANPYPPGHVDHPRWQAGHDRTSQREAARALTPPTGSA